MLDEDRSRAYRIVRIERLDALGPSADPLSVRGLRQRLDTLIAPMIERAGAELSIPAGMADAAVIHAIAQCLDFEPIAKQALLECHGLLARDGTDRLVGNEDVRSVASRTMTDQEHLAWHGLRSNNTFTIRSP